MPPFLQLSAASCQLRASYCGAALSGYQGLELMPELLQSTHHWSRARIAQHADRLAGHVLRHLEQRVEIFVGAVAGDDAIEDARGPGRALAALRALSAALVREETRQPCDLPRN